MAYNIIRPGIVNSGDNISPRKVKRAGNNVRGAKLAPYKKFLLIIAGILIGLAIPYMVDYVLFGDFTPCHTLKTYEDGSTLLGCNVRG